MWERELEGLRERIAALDVEAAAREARSGAVRWRRVISPEALLSPLPLLARSRFDVTGRWLEDVEDPSADPDFSGSVVGLDAQARPLIALSDAGTEFARVEMLWHHGPETVERFVFVGGSVDRVEGTLAVAEHGRPVRFVAVGDWGEELRVGRIEWRAGDAVRCLESVSHTTMANAYLTRAVHGPEGELIALYRGAVGLEGVLEDDEEEFDRAAQLLHLRAGLERAAELTAERLVWDGRLHRREPLPLRPMELVEPLAQALAHAIRGAVEEQGPPDPFLVTVEESQEDAHRERPALPPLVRVAGARWRDRMRASSRDDREALRSLWRGEESGDVVALRLVDLLDEGALCACRALSGARELDAPDEEADRVGPVFAALGERLSELLHTGQAPGAPIAVVSLASSSWAGEDDASEVWDGDYGSNYEGEVEWDEDEVVAEPRRGGWFAEVVEFAIEHVLGAEDDRKDADDDGTFDAEDDRSDRPADVHPGEGLGLARARRFAGDARVDALIASTASTMATTDPTSSLERARRALTDRDALAELLAHHGLAGHAQHIAHELAEEGLLLETPAVGHAPVRSRLGGNGLLPVGEAWPTSGPRSMSFLAGIDLAELPAVPVSALLPRSGWLLVFAALDLDDDSGLLDVATNRPGEPIRVFVTRGDVEVSEVAPPPDLRSEEREILRARPFVGRPVLTIPDGYDAGEEILGLDVYAAESYGEVVELLREALGPASIHHGHDTGQIEGAHWMGGHASGVQGHAPEDGSVLLLQLGWDGSLGFEFADGGSFQFRIDRAALRRGEWEAITAHADSC